MRKFLALPCLLLALASLTLWAQPTLTNDDVIKLSKSGLSEDFVLNLVDQQGSRLSSDVSRLVELKNAGVSERIITAVSKKNAPAEPLTTDGVLRLTKAGFSDGFIVELLNRYPGKFSTDSSRIVELKRAGVSEKVLSAMLAQGGARTLPSGPQTPIRLIDPIDSEKNREGEEFRASLDEPITVGNDVVAPKGADARVKLAVDKESGKFTGKTELTVQLVSLTMDGRTIPVTSSNVVESSGSRGARTAKTAGAVGAVGAIIGAIAGGGKGAAIGAGAGAAAGAGSQVFMKGQRVRIPSETVLTFTTQGDVKLP